MGRRKGERRLVDPVFKMADGSMANFIQTENFESRSTFLFFLPIIPCFISLPQLTPVPFRDRETTGDESRTNPYNFVACLPNPYNSLL